MREARTRAVRATLLWLWLRDLGLSVLLYPGTHHTRFRLGISSEVYQGLELGIASDIFDISTLLYSNRILPRPLSRDHTVAARY